MDRERLLRLYIIFIGVLTAAVASVSAYFVATMPHHQLLDSVPVAVLFVLLGWFTSRQTVFLGESNSLAMGTVTQVATLLVLPFYPLAILTITCSKLLSELSLRTTKGGRKWRAVAVNTGGTVLANSVAGGAFYLLRGNHFLFAGGIKPLLALPALAALGVSYHVIDVIIIVAAISLSSSDAPWSVLRSSFRGVQAPMVSLLFVGIIFALLWHFSPSLSMFVAVPVVFSARSFEAVSKMQKETIQAVLKIAESIDYRDTGTSDHSRRLAELTERLASSLNLIPEHVNEIVMASRVHDLGKIGIGNEILLKDGPLTSEERQVIEGHPTLGADILANYSVFRSSVDIVRHHHERWDGTGYPSRLKGEAIPLGARIISVVDAYDSMTADRPYRDGMPVETAVHRLKAGIGTQFDPQVCGKFIQLLIEAGTYEPADISPNLRVVQTKVTSAS